MTPTLIPQQVVLNFMAGGLNAAQSTVSFTPTSRIADNVETVVVSATLRDGLGNPLVNRSIELLAGGSGNTITFNNPATTNANGYVTFQLASTVAQTKSLSLRDTLYGVDLPVGTVTFLPGSVDAAQSSVTISGNNAAANDDDLITVTITLRDAFGNAVPGLAAGLSTTATNTSLNQPALPSDPNGRLVATVSSGSIEPVVLQVVADGVLLEDKPVLSFIGADVRLNKSGPAVGIIGRVVTYSLTVANQGLLSATDVTVVDTFPSHLTYLTHTAPVTPSQVGPDVIWQIGSLAPGQSQQFYVVGQLAGSATLNSQLSNTAQATSSTAEANASNNSDGHTITVLPGFDYTASVEPTLQTAAIGASVNYDIVVRNTGNLPDTYQFALNDLNSGWYTLQPSTLDLGPGEIGQANLTIHTNSCGDVGAYQFFALVSSEGVGNTQTVPADLTLTTTPNLNALLPANNTAIGATSALFTWQTAVSGTTSIFIRPAGTTTFTEYTGATGTAHQVNIDGLSRNTSYEWYASTTTLCGTATSAMRTLQVLNGVEFSPRSHTFTIERDYNQLRTVPIHNQDTVSHTMILTVENPYPELIIGFVGAGSVDEPLVLQAGETRNVQLAIHGQDVIRTDFDLVARLLVDDVTNDTIEDAIPIHIHVNIPNIDLLVEEIDSDPQTLVKNLSCDQLG